jgi:hypothetical protein
MKPSVSFNGSASGFYVRCERRISAILATLGAGEYNPLRRDRR